jgi:hypothetical protein
MELAHPPRAQTGRREGATDKHVDKRATAVDPDTLPAAPDLPKEVGGKAPAPTAAEAPEPASLDREVAASALIMGYVAREHAGLRWGDHDADADPDAEAAASDAEDPDAGGFAGDSAWERDAAQWGAQRARQAEEGADGTPGDDSDDDVYKPVISPLPQQEQPEGAAQDVPSLPRPAQADGERRRPRRRAEEAAEEEEAESAAVPVRCSWRKGSLFSLPHALSLRSRLQAAAGAGAAEVVSVSTTERRVRRPLPMNTVELLVGGCRYVCCAMTLYCIYT